MKIKYTAPLRGDLSIPGDKSISHRSVMFGALAEGTTEVTNFLTGADCLSTIACFRRMGIDISLKMDAAETVSGSANSHAANRQTGGHVRIHGKGLHGLSAPAEQLDAGNSGTTVRLLSGILAGQTFDSCLTGDASIQKRPMKRIMTPLEAMGADIVSMRGNGCAPLAIHGKQLHGAHYDSPVASAQVKSCILLAGLYADGITSVSEPALSRNHSELMLRYFGADVRTDSDDLSADGAIPWKKSPTVYIAPEPTLTARSIHVPGDISSAAYFIAAALLVPGSELLLRNVGINPTRDGMLRVCRAMGADLTLLNKDYSGPEPCADLLVRSSALKAVEIGGDLIPTLIDELPILAVLAAFADGTTVIRDAAELRVKESDRIAVMTENLSRIGCAVEATPDGMIITGTGGRPLHGAVIDPHKDHRVAMSFAVAALASEGETEIQDADCVTISYPGFFKDLNEVCR
ncbi:MAG: 3-phosphoshikimate 1-carboxyvinyltransferase [Lachnospiraceae bacterium]|nr:3-phosphoshikimate 1-carboxyvinyltransferase [Lachnospiraceae bacterium]